MAVATLNLREYFRYLDSTPNCRNVVEGEAVLNAKHLILCGTTGTHQMENSSFINIVALCLQTSSLTSAPHEIKGSLKVQSNVCEIQTFSCTCKAGLGGRCKHISAVLLHCTRTNIYELEEVSRTSLECLWNKEKKGKSFEQYKPQPLLTTACFTEIPHSQKFSLSIEQEEEFRKQFVEKLPNCAFSIHKLKYFRNVENRSETVVDPISNITGNLVNNDMLLVNNIFECASYSLPIIKLYDFHVSCIRTCCAQTYNNLIVDVDERHLCIISVHNKEKWKQERQFRITASRCYGLYTYKGNNWYQKAKKYFWNKPINNKYTNHGLKYETDARTAFTSKSGCEVVQVGLVICRREPWLACSPDGIILKNDKPHSLLEIKCAYQGKDMSSSNLLACSSYLKIIDGETYLLWTSAIEFSHFKFKGV